ncbi:putative Peptidase M23B [uncultured Alphaproteobacteria bacterium]|uniref:Putative Peptidase M23B n=1 Tax=uncultured Alphaproteobacteria bacterium TaxID=91750 RepID=A0A212KLC9_9PROT|nr:putative Peptidase M23B [uncultured Alphaproteobacteria bacterium]
MRARRTLLAFTALSLAALAAAPALANPARPLSAGHSASVAASETRSLTLAPKETLDQVLRRIGIDAAERKAVLAALKETGVAPAVGAKLTLRTEIPRPGTQRLALLRIGGGAKQPDVVLVGTPEIETDAPLRRSVRGTVGPDFPSFLVSIGVPDGVAATVAAGFGPGQPAPGARFNLVYRLTADKSDAQLASLTVHEPAGEQRLAAFPLRRSLEVGIEDAPTPARTERALPPQRQAEDAVEGIPTGDPVPGGRLTSPWGWRIHPVLKRPQFHKGVDYSAPAGTPVLATAPGTVAFVGRNGNYGKLVRITHAGEVVTGYAHLQDYARGLKVGAKVSQGQVIGYVGRSGLATGNHLYYEVFARGKLVDPLGGQASPSRHMTEAENARLRQALSKRGIVLARDGVTLD